MTLNKTSKCYRAWMAAALVPLLLFPLAGRAEQTARPPSGDSEIQRSSSLPASARVAGYCDAGVRIGLLRWYYRTRARYRGASVYRVSPLNGGSLKDRLELRKTERNIRRIRRSLNEVNTQIRRINSDVARTRAINRRLRSNPSRPIPR